MKKPPERAAFSFPVLSPGVEPGFPPSEGDVLSIERRERGSILVQLLKSTNLYGLKLEHPTQINLGYT